MADGIFDYFYTICQGLCQAGKASQGAPSVSFECKQAYVEIWHHTVDNDFDFSNDQTIHVEEAQQLIAQFGSCLVTDPEGFISFGEYGAMAGK